MFSSSGQDGTVKFSRGFPSPGRQTAIVTVVSQRKAQSLNVM
jgi:hypothetical protein